MVNCTVTGYINEFKKHLVRCTNMYAAEAKFIFETNMTNWLTLYTLPYNCTDLP